MKYSFRQNSAVLSVVRAAGPRPGAGAGREGRNVGEVSSGGWCPGSPDQLTGPARSGEAPASPEPPDRRACQSWPRAHHLGHRPRWQLHRGCRHAVPGRRAYGCRSATAGFRGQSRPQQVQAEGGMSGVMASRTRPSAVRARRCSSSSGTVIWCFSRMARKRGSSAAMSSRI